MAKPINYTGALGSKFVAPTSRYADKRAIYYGEARKLTYPIYKKNPVSFAPDDKHYEISKEMEYRPDKVSVQFYGAPDYWWKIMEVNNMKDILEFKAGRNIRLPGGFLM